MQIYTRYKLKGRRSGVRSWLYTTLALGCLGFLGWLLYHSARDLVPVDRPREMERGPRVLVPVPPQQQPTLPSATGQVSVGNPALIRSNGLSPGLTSNLSGGALFDRGTSAPPVMVPLDLLPPRLQVPSTVLEAQIALARQGISSGSIDGVLGSQTRAALRTFQRREGIPVTGLLDAATQARLAYQPPSLTTYLVTSNDVERLRPLQPTWLGKSRQDRLDFESVLELVAEKAQAHPGLVQRLNAGIDWSTVRAGARVTVPEVQAPEIPSRADSIHIRLSAKTLQARDAQGKVLAHFPCSIARRVEKRPLGTLRVVLIVRNPNYTFNPEVFPESAEGRRLGRKLVLPPGPNSPVGVAWIGLDRPGYGIHGTPKPEEVGRTESHGCFRLANWNAELLANLVSPGIRVHVGP